MTVVSPIDEVHYIGSGITGPYGYTFRIFQNTDLLVTTGDLFGNLTTLTYLVDYTVTGATLRNGGAVTLAVALPTGYALTIQRNVPVVQARSIRNQGEYDSSVVEDMLDYTAMIDQEQQGQIDRSIKLPPTVAGSSATEITSFLPSKYLRVNAQGTGVEGVDIVTASQNFIQSGGGAVTRTMQAKAAEQFTGTDFGMIGDGSTDNTAKLAAAATARAATGGQLVVPVGVYRLASSSTVGGTLVCETNAVLKLDANVVLTLTGQFIGDLTQHFDTSASGALVKLNAFKTGDICPQWWGMGGSVLSDDSHAVNAAINSIDTSTGAGGEVVISTTGLGLGTTGLILRNYVKVRCAGSRQTFINYTGAGRMIDARNCQFSGISGARLFMGGASSTAIGIDVSAPTTSTEYNRFEDLELVSASVAGQIGIYGATNPGVTDISANIFRGVHIDTFDQPIVEVGPEGNFWDDCTVSNFGTASGAIAVNSVSLDNIVRMRIAGNGPGATAGPIAYQQGGARNIADLVTDMGGMGGEALNVTGLGNIIRIQRPEGATALGSYHVSTTIIDGDAATFPRSYGGGTALATSNFVLSTGFGSTRSVVSVSGSDDRFTLSIHAGGSGITANPTIAMTWATPWRSIPYMTPVRSAGDQLTIPIIAPRFFTFTNVVTMVFAGTPADGDNYEVTVHTRG